MKKILLGLSVALILAGSLVMWGSIFATSMVHDQLAAQKIVFPPKDLLEKDNPKLVAYASQQVDSGPEAKAYSNYIAGHLQKIAGGKTYSEVSSEYQKNREDQTLAQQRQNLFMGETLRGLLLNAWGWGLIGAIALYASLAIFILAVVLLVVVILIKPKQVKNNNKKSKAKK